MRIIEVKAYQFDELGAKAQDRAIEHYCYNMCVDLEDDVQYWREMLEANGFMEPVIDYSVNGCQGDGASFTARIDKDHFLVGKYECLKDVAFDINIQSKGGLYVHTNTKYFDVCIYFATDRETYLIHKLWGEITILRSDLCERMYSNLKAAYDYEVSNENIKELLVINEYEFTEEGERI
jgi:hypothetical protein